MLSKKVLASSLAASALMLGACSGGSGGGEAAGDTAMMASGSVTVDCPTSEGWSCKDGMISYEGGSVNVLISKSITSDLDEAYEFGKTDTPGQILGEEEKDGAKIFIGGLSDGSQKFALYKEVGEAVYECYGVVEAGAPDSLKQDISGVCTSMR